jgi:hypothetical protein
LIIPTYYHFISDLPNGVSFVVTVWKEMLHHLQHQNITDIQIWSDGGPKHFNLSSHLYFWWQQVKSGLLFNITYNFFEVLLFVLYIFDFMIGISWA